MEAGSQTDQARPVEYEKDEITNGQVAPGEPRESGHAKADAADDSDEADEAEEDEEPTLKYVQLTGQLSSVYKSGDTTSAVLVSGDKLILGTHNGNVHVFELPSLRTLRTYRAHTASITSISVSPFSPRLSSAPAINRAPNETSRPSTPVQSSRPKSAQVTPNHGRAASLSSKPSNQIHIATSCIDGHVCVSSLIDVNDVVLRNFSRPLRTVAISPEFKYDRAYLSGGLSGDLVLTTGGRIGVKQNANFNKATAAASGFLGSIGLSSDNGKDVVIHSGEGSISLIQWSLSGRYVVWINEQGIKIARSASFLRPEESDLAWKRIAHIDKPTRDGWQDMAEAWKTSAQWYEDRNLEAEEARSPSYIPSTFSETASITSTPSQTPQKLAQRSKASSNEHLLVGWGDTVWVISVKVGKFDKKGIDRAGEAEVLHRIVFPDGVVSGLSQYTPSLLLVLVFRTVDDNDTPIHVTPDGSANKKTSKRQNSLPPDLRLVDLNSAEKDEKEVTSLSIRRYESLSVGDYHLSTVFYPQPKLANPQQQSTLKQFGQLGESFLDMGFSATRMFSSGASMLSGSSNDEKQEPPIARPVSPKRSPSTQIIDTIPPIFAKPGMKILLCTPYDCLVAAKRDDSDHLGWLVEQKDYERAWRLLDAKPEVIPSKDSKTAERPGSPTPTRSHQESYMQSDSGSMDSFAFQSEPKSSAAEVEKNRIGDLWVQSLVDAKNWPNAAKIASKVIKTGDRWDHWISTFTSAGQFDTITAVVPSYPLRPQISRATYDILLKHYLSEDVEKFRELVDRLDFRLYDNSEIASEIETRLNARAKVLDDATKTALRSCLATLYEACGRLEDALRCHMLVHNAKAAFALVEEHNLFPAISGEVYEFLALPLGAKSPASIPFAELDRSTRRPVLLVASASLQTLVSTDSVVAQLTSRKGNGEPFLFFYFRALWLGDVLSDTGTPTTSRAPSPTRYASMATSPIAVQSRTLLTPYADTVITLFAEYSRPLLTALLKSYDAATLPASPSASRFHDSALPVNAEVPIPFSYDHALQVCESRGYVPELVHLLSATGQSKKALRLIIEEQHDIRAAMAYVQRSGDETLWNDLLDYSFTRAEFIKILLEEIAIDGGDEGAGLNALDVVKRIPDGLEIEGLKDALVRLMHECRSQTQVAHAAEGVIKAEISDVMLRLRKEQESGLLLDTSVERSEDIEDFPIGYLPQRPLSQACAECREPSFSVDTSESIVAFRCGHVFHLRCLLEKQIHSSTSALAEQLNKEMDKIRSRSTSESAMEDKISRMQRIYGALGPINGCPLCNASQ